MKRYRWILLAVGVLSGAGVAAWGAQAATLRIVAKDQVLMLTLEHVRAPVKVTSKPERINPGEYQVKKFSIYKQDDRKRTWEIRCEKNLGNMKVLMVAPGQDKVLDPGPPLTMHSWAMQGKGDKADTVSISFSLVGKYSEVYLPYAFCGRRQPHPPVVTVTAADGKVLARAAMKVGDSGQCRYEWRPGRFKGPYNVSFEADTGPFKWNYKQVGKYEVR